MKLPYLAALLALTAACTSQPKQETEYITVKNGHFYQGEKE